MSMLARKLSSHTLHDYTIETEDDQPLFGLIYSLSAVELNILKKYIKNNLEKSFIVLFTFPVGAPILFTKKKNRSLQLCMDYWSLNALTRKNKHPLPLINEVLDQLIKAKIYTCLDLKNTYNFICIYSGRHVNSDLDSWKFNPSMLIFLQPPTTDDYNLMS